ncbi:MAG: hypothetical protein CMO26_09795 [Thiotrichales bacterium]|nr:hypothetical protein [Thiotrichales bacterium]
MQHQQDRTTPAQADRVPPSDLEPTRRLMTVAAHIRDIAEWPFDVSIAEIGDASHVEFWVVGPRPVVSSRIRSRIAVGSRAAKGHALLQNKLRSSRLS